MRITDQDKKEIAIWAGAAFVGILLVNSFLIGGQVDSLKRDITQGNALESQYKVFYPENQTGRLPEAQAQNQANAVLAQQLKELDRARAQLIFPGQSNLVPQELKGFDFKAGTDYNSSRNLVQEVNRRLSGRGTSWSVRMPEVLPFEGAGDINADEDGNAKRGLQMAQLAAYGTLYEHLLSARPESIGAVNLSSAMYCDKARQIAVIPVATSVTGNFDHMRRIEQLLRESTAGLSLHSWNMRKQGQKYSVELHASLMVPMHQEWPLDSVSVQSASGRDPRGAQ